MISDRDSPAGTEPGAWPRGRPPSNAAALAALGVVLALAASRLVYPYDAGYYEALVLPPAELLARGINPYSLGLATDPPYVVSGYGPVYYLLVAGGVRMFGPTLWFGRLIAIAGAIGCVVLVSKVARSSGAPPWAGTLGAALFASCAPVPMWIGAHRPDFVALLASLAGLALTLTARHRRSFVLAGTAGALFGIGVATRQTGVAALFAALLLCMQRRDGRTAAGLAFGVLLAGLAPLAALDSSSNGGLVEQMWLMPASLPRSGARLAHHLGAMATSPSMWAVFSLAAWHGAAVVLWPGRQGEPSSDRAITAGWVLSCAIAAVSASIPGANVNYFLEPTALAAILATRALEPLSATRSPARVARAATLVALAGAGVIGLRSLRGEYYRWEALPYYDDLVSELRRSVPASEPCHSLYPELAMAAGRIHYVNTMSGYEQSERLRRVRDRLLADRVFAAVISTSPLPPAGYRHQPLSRPRPRRYTPAYLHLRVGASASPTR
jgi:hypothetical protein